MMSQTSPTTDRRRFSLIIHTDNAINARSYDIAHPYSQQQPASATEMGRRPLTGSLMMVKPNDSKEQPSIKIRTMSCPLLITAGRAHRGSAEDRRLSLKEAYNSKYVEKLKKDLLDFYNQQGRVLEEEVIEEENSTGEEEEPLLAGVQRELNDWDQKMLSSCVSNRSTLTPPLEEMECDSAPESCPLHHKSASVCSSASGNFADRNSIYSFNAEQTMCGRHHHRRPSCAIKFEEPKVLEWDKLTDSQQEFEFIDEDKLASPNHPHGHFFKDNYSLAPTAR